MIKLNARPNRICGQYWTDENSLEFLDRASIVTEFPTYYIVSYRINNMKELVSIPKLWSRINSLGKLEGTSKSTYSTGTFNFMFRNGLL